MGKFLLLLRGFAPSSAVIYAVAGVGLLALIAYMRLHWIQVGREEILRENVQAAIRIVNKVQVVTKTVETVRIKREKEIEHVFHTVFQDVVREVPVRVGCNVTRGWMRGHDYAAAGDDRSKPGGLDDKTDTGIDEAQALGVVGDNYKKFHQVANDLKACRSAVAGIQKALADK